MIKKIKPSPFVAHVLLTTAASLATILANIFVIRFLANGFGAEGFGAYSLASRCMAFLVPFSTLALCTALPRFISLAGSEHAKREYLLSGFLLGLVPNLLILTGGALGSGFLTRLIFHDARYQILFFMTLFWVAAFSFYSILDAFYFGIGQIRKANFWQIFLGVAGPLLIALIFSKRGNVEEVVSLFGILYLTSLIPLGFHLFLAIAAKPAWTVIRSRIQDLWSYALPRFPVRFVLASLFSIGPFLAPRFGALQDAGFLMVGQMVFRIAELGSTAFGRVLLPKAGELFSEGRQDYLNQRIEDIVIFVFQMGLFVTLQLILWSGPIVLAWLGGPFAEAIPLMQILTLAVAPYLLFIMLSPIVDAIEEKPVNLKHLLLSFIVALFSSVVAGKIFSKTGLAFGTALGLATPGFLTLFYLWKRCQISFQLLKVKEVLLWNLAFLFAGILLKNGLAVHWEGIRLLGAGMIGEGLLLCLYLFVLWQLHPRWIGELEKRLFIVPREKTNLVET